MVAVGRERNSSDLSLEPHRWFSHTLADASVVESDSDEPETSFKLLAIRRKENATDHTRFSARRA